MVLLRLVDPQDGFYGPVPRLALESGGLVDEQVVLMDGSADTVDEYVCFVYLIWFCW